MYCLKGGTKTIKTIRILSKTLSSLLVAAVVLLALLLGGIRLVGFTPYTVLSGSMEPTYHVGSVIYVKDVEPVDLKAGDSITYRMTSGTVVTHRIHEVLNQNTPDLAFRTKGDANEDPDGTPVPAAAVVGKAVFSIPCLGYVSEFVQKPTGLIAIGCVCIAVWIISVAVDLLGKPKDDNSDPGAHSDGDVPPST